MIVRRFRNQSIRQRLTLIIMAVSCVSVLLTTLAISAVGVISLKKRIVAELDVSATIVGQLNHAYLEFDQYSNAEDNLTSFAKKPAIVQACLYDHSSLLGDSMDKAVARYIGKDYRKVANCPDDLTERTVINDDSIQWLHAIYDRNGGIAGYMYVESTLAEVERYIEKQTTIAIVVSLMAMLVSYLLAVNLQRTISRPILSLADTAHQVSLQKDYSIRAARIENVEGDHNNELVILTDSFNEMLAEIGARETQLKKQNVALEKAKDAAESANRAKSQFLANISHELRTPLNAVIGFSSILMNQLFGALGNEKYIEYAHDINESGVHLLNIINDILDLSKAEAGKLALTYEEVHVGKAIQKSITILSDRATQGKVTVSTDVPKMLPPLMVDRLRFIQILLNVLSNAIKFTPQGGSVDISARVEEAPDNVSQFVIRIKDTGIGMSKDDVDKAFQSFGQVDSGLNRKYEGTGLGLPLTKKLVELHQGQIVIESEVGKGTVVKLIFPAIGPDDIEMPVEE